MNETLRDRLAACRLGWAVDWADGPASRWPRLEPRPSIAQFCLDRQGFGIPAESLPLSLSPYSVCGWKLAVRNGSLVLEAGSAEPVNEWGCRRHLEGLKASALLAFKAWVDLQHALAELASSAKPVSAGASPQEQAPRAKLRKAWAPKVARRDSVPQGRQASSGDAAVPRQA